MDVLCLRRYGLLTMRKLIAIALLFATSQAWAAFGYYSPISINSAQVPSTQTDFPVLVSVTDARFKTTGNGGHVQNSSGFDIRPYTDSTLTSAITGYELERYNASTGEVIMWVKVSSLSSSTTPFVLAYGDSGISTDGSSNTTWSNSFGAVWHVKDGTTLSLADSSATGNNLVLPGGAANPTATTGQIDGGGGFASASSQHLDSGSTFTPSAITYSIWAKATSFPAAYNYPMDNVKSGGSTFHLISVKSNGKMRWAVSATTQLDADGTGTHTQSTGTSYYFVLTYDSTNGLKGYINAASDVTVSANGNASGTMSIVEIGGLGVFNLQYWNGTLDEARLASVARSADWITTEYNNQSAPGTFETLGTEVAVTTSASGWFFFFP